MANAYSMGDLLDFLTHAGDRGMMPAATATALSVAVRNVFGVLEEDERKDLSRVGLDGAIRRFNNKRARDFNPSSLKEYGRRVQRAVNLFLAWKEDPSNFSIKTRTTKSNSTKGSDGPKTKGKKGHASAPIEGLRESRSVPHEAQERATADGGYSSSLSIRADCVVTISNIPADLTQTEANRLAKFVGMLAVE